jgi:ubiquitin-protein ligase
MNTITTTTNPNQTPSPTSSMNPITPVIKERTITKETINRLLKDVRQILKNPLTDNGIYYVHDEEDMLKGNAMIVGPEGTPYFGGYYFFEFNFPYDYPFSPPKVKFMTNNGFTRFNPNLYKCGKVCVSILNTWNGDKWSSCQTINSILLTLCSLLNDTPFLNEPGQTLKSRDCISYHSSITFMNISYSVCDLIANVSGQIPQQFLTFYDDMVTLFLKNYETLKAFVQKQKTEVEYLNVQIYAMNTCVDYKLLANKLESVKNKLEMENQKEEKKEQKEEKNV